MKKWLSFVSSCFFAVAMLAVNAGIARALSADDEETSQESEAAGDRQAGEAEDEGDAVRFVEEIVVTAGKRETFLLETPIAVTAPGQEQLDLLNVNDVTNIGQLVPSLNTIDTSIDGGGGVDINLRGIDNANYLETGDPVVSISIGGVYSARPQAALQLFYDVERVEVARGPQGTLAGRNAAAGSINIIPNRPVPELFDASAEFEVANEDGRAFRGMLNYPIVDNQLAFRFNAALDQRDSPYNLVRDDFNTAFNVPSQSGAFEASHGSLTDEAEGGGSRDDQAFRAALIYTPEETPLTVLLEYENFQDGGPGNPAVNDCSRTPCTLTAADGIFPTGIESSQLTEIARDDYTSLVSTPFRQDLKIDNYRAQIQYDFGETVSAKGIYGQSDFHTDLIQDLDGGTGIELIFTNDWSNDSEVMEFNLTSLHGGPFSWTLGYFDFSETNDRRLWIAFPPFGWVAFSQPDIFTDSEAIFADATYDLGNFEIFGGYRDSTDNKGNIGGHQLSPAGGACPAGPGDWGTVPFDLIDSDADGNPSTGVFGIDCAVADLSTPEIEASFEDYRFGFGYQSPNSEIYWYTSVATGHKGRPPDIPLVSFRTSAQQLVPVKVEENTTFEIGAKGSVGKLNFSATAFYADFKDKQENSIINFGDQFCDDPNQPGNQPLINPATGGPLQPCAAPGSPFVDLDDTIFPDQNEFVLINIPGMDVLGVEFEYDIALGKNDYFSGFFTWIDAEFKDGFEGGDKIGCGLRFAGDPRPRNSFGCPIETLDGNRPRNTPEFTFNATYYHIFELRSGASFVPLINAYYRSDQHLTIFNREGVSAASLGLRGDETNLFSDVQDSVTKFNINLRYTMPSGKISFELFGSNVTDETVISHERIDSDPWSMYQLEDPAEWGLRARVRFW